jgi:hypothetical protein
MQSLAIPIRQFKNKSLFRHDEWNRIGTRSAWLIVHVLHHLFPMMLFPFFLHPMYIRMCMISNRIFPPLLILLAFQRHRVFEIVCCAVQRVVIYATRRDSIRYYSSCKRSSLPFLCGSLTLVSEMGDTKPMGRGLCCWFDIVGWDGDLEEGQGIRSVCRVVYGRYEGHGVDVNAAAVVLGCWTADSHSRCMFSDDPLTSWSRIESKRTYDGTREATTGYRCLLAPLHTYHIAQSCSRAHAPRGCTDTDTQPTHSNLSSFLCLTAVTTSLQ